MLFFFFVGTKILSVLLQIGVFSPGCRSDGVLISSVKRRALAVQIEVICEADLEFETFPTPHFIFEFCFLVVVFFSRGCCSRQLM